MNRRKFINAGSLAASGLVLNPLNTAQGLNPSAFSGSNLISQEAFWPNGARLAVSISLQFEAGGQPISGASGLIPEPIKQDYPDLATNSYFDYGVQEGIPRLLNLFDNI